MTDSEWAVRKEQLVRRHWPALPPGWEKSAETALPEKIICPTCGEKVEITRHSVYSDEPCCQKAHCGTKRMVFIKAADCGHVAEVW